MLAATVQRQQQQIDELRAEVHAMRAVRGVPARGAALRYRHE